MAKEEKNKKPTHQEIIEKQAKTQVRMLELLELAASENRDLTEAERIEYDREYRTAQYLQTQLAGTVQPNTPARRQLEVIVEAIDAIVNQRDVSQYGDMVAGNEIKYRAELQTTSTSVAAITPDYHTEIIEPLQKKLIVDKLGCTIINNPTGNVKLPTSNNVDATIEGETTKTTAQQVKFSAKSADPKRVSICIPFSNRSIRQASINLISYAQKLMVIAAAQAINKWMFSETQLTNASKGCFVDSTPVNVTKATFGWDDVVGLETSVAEQDVDITDGTSAYVASAKINGLLKTTEKSAGTGRFLIEKGVMNEYPVLVSNHVGANSLGFGVFSNVAVIQYEDFNIVVDAISRANENITQITYNCDFDIEVIEPKAFGLLKVTDLA